MYTPLHFNETRLDVLHQLIETYPLGTLVTLEPEGMNANHLPFEIIAPTADAPFGTLRAHFARSNPLWKNLDPTSESLIVFQGPQTYITPSWYEEKKLSGKVVPTYNYAVVHGYGKIRIVDEPQWILELLNRLTKHHEEKQKSPWQISDAPHDYIEKMLAAIMGVEIVLTTLTGKWKTSQNRPVQDRINIATALRTSSDKNEQAMATMLESSCKLK